MLGGGIIFKCKIFLEDEISQNKLAGEGQFPEI